MDGTFMEPTIIGGRDLSSTRPNYDETTGSLILASTKHLAYYDSNTGNHLGEIHPKFQNDLECIVACERHDRCLYVCTSSGRILVWSLDQKEWITLLQLLLENEHETVCSLKVASPLCFVYTVLNDLDNIILIYTCVLRSPHESPTRRQKIDVITEKYGSRALDIGYVSDDSHHNSDYCYVAYINERMLRLNSLPLLRNVKPEFWKRQQHIQMSAEFTCIRAHPSKALIATGDSIGRIFIYVGDLFNRQIIRTELHWHSMQVNDMCFSHEGSMLFSVGAEAGCVACWDLGMNTFGQKKIIARLGLPFKHIAYDTYGSLILSNIDNETMVLSPNKEEVRCCIKSFTRSAANDVLSSKDRPFGLLWYPNSDSVVTTANFGVLQFFSPHSRQPLYKKDFLGYNILSNEADREISQSIISCGAISLDGKWLALFQTRQDSFSLPEVKLKLWKKKADDKWKWIQTIERPHKSVIINDLQFSPDSRMLVSTSDDETFQLWYRIGKTKRVDQLEEDQSKDQSEEDEIQSYARGYNGKTVGLKPTLTCFSQDCSVLALGIRETSVLLWSVENEQRMSYQTQLSLDMVRQDISDIIGLNFGYDKCSGFLCEVRSDSVRVWSIYDADCRSEYKLKSVDGKITHMAFDHCNIEHNPTNCFVVITDRCDVLLFDLLTPTPLIKVSAATSVLTIGVTFVEKSIVETKNASNSLEETLLRRLCILNDRQELVALTDKISLESQKSGPDIDDNVRTLSIADLGMYFINNSIKIDRIAAPSKHKITEIEEKKEIDKALNKIFLQVPSHMLPPMTELGPMILSKLIKS